MRIWGERGTDCEKIVLFCLLRFIEEDGKGGNIEGRRRRRIEKSLSKRERQLTTNEGTERYWRNEEGKQSGNNE